MRIIARLDIKNEMVIKGVNFEGLRVVGKPNDLGKKYYEDGADELIYIDNRSLVTRDPRQKEDIKIILEF